MEASHSLHTAPYTHVRDVCVCVCVCVCQAVGSEQINNFLFHQISVLSSYITAEERGEERGGEREDVYSCEKEEEEEEEEEEERGGGGHKPLSECSL